MARLLQLEMVELQQDRSGDTYHRFDNPFWQVIESAEQVAARVQRGSKWNLPDRECPVDWNKLRPYLDVLERNLVQRATKTKFLVWAAYAKGARVNLFDFLRDAQISGAFRPEVAMKSFLEMGMIKHLGADIENPADPWERVPSPWWQVGVVLGQALEEYLQDPPEFETVLPSDFRLDPPQALLDVNAVPVMGSDSKSHYALLIAPTSLELVNGIYRELPKAGAPKGASEITICGKRSIKALAQGTTVQCEVCSPKNSDNIRFFGDKKVRSEAAAALEAKWSHEALQEALDGGARVLAAGMFHDRLVTEDWLLIRGVENRIAAVRHLGRRGTVIALGPPRWSYFWAWRGWARKEIQPYLVKG